MILLLSEPQNTISDHMVVHFKIFVDDIPKIKAMINFRDYKSLDVVDFSDHLLTNYEQILFSNCTHLPNIPAMCVNCKTNFYRLMRQATLTRKLFQFIRNLLSSKLVEFGIIVKYMKQKKL